MKKKFSSVPDPDIQDAVIYARYSSHSQRDCSIEQQVADCELFAQQNGLRVVKIYADRHLSGTTDNRPEFQQMLKDAAHGHWPFVICWKIDRFARNRYDSATYKYKLKKLVSGFSMQRNPSRTAPRVSCWNPFWKVLPSIIAHLLLRTSAVGCASMPRTVK